MPIELTAVLLALGASAFTMVGWILVARRRVWTSRAAGYAMLASATAMVAISLFELLPASLRQAESPARALALFGAGVVMVPVVHLVVARLAPGLDALQGSATLVVLAMTLHNIPEGAVPFAATLISLSAGIVTAIAIAAHNVPEGMAVSAAVLAAGGSRKRALVFTSISMGGEMLGAMLALAIGSAMGPAVSTDLMAVVAGLMVALSLGQLAPTSIRLITGTTAFDPTRWDASAEQPPTLAGAGRQR